MPRPPRSQRTKARARSTSAFDMPQRSMTVPAKMKDGIASKTQFCDPAIMLEATISELAARRYCRRVRRPHCLGVADCLRVGYCGRRGPEGWRVCTLHGCVERDLRGPGPGV